MDDGSAPTSNADYSATGGLKASFEQGCLALTLSSDPGNRVDYHTLSQLQALCDRAAVDPAVRVLVIDGAGDDFCLGDAWPAMGDVPAEFQTRVPAGTHGAAPIVEQAALGALRNCMKPTVAILHGATRGFGLDLIAVCDVRWALADATIADDRIHQGRAASTGISYVLPRLIGQSQATRLLLLGETIDAQEAVRIQLVHEVFDNRQTVNDGVMRLANFPTRAWEIHKMQVLPQLDLGFDAAMTHCLGVRQTHVIEDQAEGMRAWRERRDPEFTGR